MKTIGTTTMTLAATTDDAPNLVLLSVKVKGLGSLIRALLTCGYGDTGLEAFLECGES